MEKAGIKIGILAITMEKKLKKLKWNMNINNIF
jgi:hypothetical protein